MMARCIIIFMFIIIYCRRCAKDGWEIADGACVLCGTIVDASILDHGPFNEDSGGEQTIHSSDTSDSEQNNSESSASDNTSTLKPSNSIMDDEAEEETGSSNSDTEHANSALFDDSILSGSVALKDDEKGRTKEEETDDSFVVDDNIVEMDSDTSSSVSLDLPNNTENNTKYPLRLKRNVQKSKHRELLKAKGPTWLGMNSSDTDDSFIARDKKGGSPLRNRSSESTLSSADTGDSIKQSKKKKVSRKRRRISTPPSTNAKNKFNLEGKDESLGKSPTKISRVIISSGEE